MRFPWEKGSGNGALCFALILPFRLREWAYKGSRTSNLRGNPRRMTEVRCGY